MDGHKIREWRCGSCNMANGHKVCSNRYVTEESFVKLFIMSWNEIVTHRQEYESLWKKLTEGDDVLKVYKIKLIIESVGDCTLGV